VYSSAKPPYLIMLCLKKFCGYIFLYMVAPSFAFQLIYYICKSIFQVNVSCLSTEEWSHSARWLQAFAELVIFVLLTLKSHWRGRWTTSVNNICLYFYKKVYIFPRKWSCRFYVKCIFMTWAMYFLENGHESLYVNYIFSFFSEMSCVLAWKTRMI